MIVTNYEISKITDTQWSVEWEASNPSLVSWLFVDGVLTDTYYDGTTTEWQETISVPRNRMIAIEVQETPIGITAESIVLNKAEEVLRWDRVEEALYYRIYHKIENGNERIIKRVYQQGGVSRYEFTLPSLEREGGVWHHFRVESVNEWELASERELWHFFAYGKPAVPSAVNVSGTGGVFNIRVDM